MRESEFRYRTVAELTSGFVYEATVDEHGEAQVVWASPGWDEFFGGSFEELNRLGWRHVFFPADHAGAIQRRQRLRSGERTEMELALKTLRGETRWVHLANQPVFDADGKVTRYIGVVHDITDRKVNEEVLRSQALAIEVMHEGVVLSDSGGIIRMTNPAFDRMFRIVAGSFIGKHLSQLPCDPPLDRRIAESADEAAARAGAPLVSELTVHGATDGDTALFVEAAITSLVLRGERFWLTMLQDATARRQLEREVLEVSNREQQRIGNDLHDGLGQELTGIALLLRGLENRAEREAPALSPSIEEVALLVNDAIFTTRALARGLSPVTFDRGGLALALEELARRLSAMFHIDVRCVADAALDHGLESVNALHLYRIAQEAVTNAAQHGHARTGADLAALRRRPRPAAHRGQRQRLQPGDAAVEGARPAHHALPRADDGRQPAHRERAHARHHRQLLVPARRTPTLSCTEAVKVQIRRSARRAVANAGGDLLAPLRGAGLVHRRAVRIDGDGDRHVLHREFVDGFHAEILERHDARRLDGLRHQVGGATHGHEVGRAMLANGLDARGPALGLAHHGDEAGLLEHHLGELVHARGGGRTRRPHHFAAHRIDRPDVVDDAIAEIDAGRQPLAAREQVGDAFVRGVAAREHACR